MLVSVIFEPGENGLKKVMEAACLFIFLYILDNSFYYPVGFLYLLVNLDEPMILRS